MKLTIFAWLACLHAGIALAQPGEELARQTAFVGISSETPSRRGWHFYDDPLADLPVKPLPKVSPRSALATPAVRPELERFRQLQREVEEVRAIAIIRPTEENVRRYMELESRVVRNASQFADLAQRIAWANPDLDPSTRGRPVNASALEAYEESQARTRGSTLAALANDHALIFFFRGDCGYCHKMAPLLNAFRQRYSFPLIAVSVDGGSIPSLPMARADNGIVRALKVAQVPAVFLAEPFTGRILPVGFGVLSESQLVERIMALTDRQRSMASQAGLFWPN
ncbi:thioredoxin family protein [Pseudoduganella eburnea]|uniref:Thioredoxin family protein n=1 Tax=Massilia eburnea TaxID=1776165 RepID=A0A6L6QEN7_9BURK|nr:conjugal transfer protein TraF [Massilia eburnea]MTW10153.1 thioredoxin family protein [Massilia eburnea]